ncbi:unnamed protein product [Symbiodinium microadriaticum]|nr:unnamed protein product [Symbiodinium microadriaticum]
MGMNEVALDLIEDVETQIKETEAECHDLHLEFSSWPMLQMASRSATSRQTFGQLKELDNTLDVFLDHVKQNLEKRIEPMCKERAILEEKTKGGTAICGYVATQLYKASELFAAGASVVGELWMIVLTPRDGTKDYPQYFLEEWHYVDLFRLFGYGVHVHLLQKAYNTNLAGLHGLDPDTSAGLPCSRGWIQDEDQQNETENYSEKEETRAQKVTLGWLTGRGNLVAQQTFFIYWVLGNGGIGWFGRKRIMSGLKLECMFLLLVTIQSLSAAAEKEPLRPTTVAPSPAAAASASGRARIPPAPTPSRVPVGGQFEGTLTVQRWHKSLTQDGMMTTGVKEDLIRRRFMRLGLGHDVPREHLPTTKQLKYVLRVWRHLWLAGPDACSVASPCYEI